MIRAIDRAAKEIAFRQWALPECLHVPVAAVNAEAIQTYIGDVVQTLSGGPVAKALLVHVEHETPVDPRLPIWDLFESHILRQREQVWVHIQYTRYRSAYQKAFPHEDVTNKVIGHIYNRRMAALKGLHFVRIVPIPRGCNSSAAYSENWGVELWSKPDELESYRRRGAFIQYGDLSDLMVMMGISIGGGVMDVVNEGQKLVRPL